MKAIKLFMFGIFIFLSTTSCNTTLSGAGKNNDHFVEINGIIVEQGMTTYQYGSHMISGYAIKSKTIDLQKYVNTNVTITGFKIEGYPVDGGPEFIEVESVKLIK